ncbi:hypothetical protein Pcinc_016298 [Petrolisthes cinctipes]|uniref:Uncharacterized protein n=1 Tax=Petrolisthes cinctipes TaxID=88211 RepID=A0AAE1FT65_PETCI|nr:hypothetical protein Pcinc_016298 [Petrolisthes cinctipes]
MLPSETMRRTSQARETADVIRAVPGLSCVSEEEIVDLVGGEYREETAEEMLNQDEEKEEDKEEEISQMNRQ